MEETLPEQPAEVGLLDTLTQFDNLFIIVVVLGFAWGFTRVVSYAVGRLADRFSEQRLLLLRFVPIIGIITWTIAVLLVVSTVFAPNEQTMAALVGASVFAIGFAAQDLFKNILGGLIILFDRPFQVGDKVEIQPYYGEIVKIGLRSTKLVTNDDNLVTVPNTKMLDTSVANGNAGALDFQVVTDVFLPAHTNVARAEELAWEAAATCPYVYLDKPIMVRITDEFKNRPLTRIRIKAYVLDIRLETLFQSDISKRAKDSFIDEGILPKNFGDMMFTSPMEPPHGPPPEVLPPSEVIADAPMTEEIKTPEDTNRPTKSSTEEQDGEST